MTTTGNLGLDALADAIAARVADKLRAGESKLMRIREAAAYLGVSRRTLEGLMGAGRIPTLRERSLARLDRGDLDKWIEMRKSSVD